MGVSAHGGQRAAGGGGGAAAGWGGRGLTAARAPDLAFLADLDPIPAGLLCFIQGFVGAVQQRRQSCAAVSRRDTGTDRNFQKILAKRQRRLRDRNEQPLSHAGRGVEVCLRQHDDDLVSAISADQVNLPQLPLAVFGYVLYHHVAGEMPVAGVDGFVGIAVYHVGRQQASVALTARELALRQLTELPPVQQPGQTVCNGQLLRVGEQLQVLAHHRELPEQDEYGNRNSTVEQTTQRVKGGAVTGDHEQAIAKYGGRVRQRA